MGDVPLDCCPECGAVLEAVREHLRLNEAHMHDLEIELRNKRALINRLKADRDKQQNLDPMRKQAEEVFDYWREKIMPKAREFSGERFDHVVARLKAGHEVSFIKQAIDGAAARPRYEGMKTDLRSICRNEANLLMYASWAEETRQAAVAADPKLEQAYEQMVAQLSSSLTDRLCELRGWTPDAVSELGLGYDSDTKRVVFPTQDHTGRLVGLSRWQPNPAMRNGRPKNLAVGSRDLFPPPETIDTESIWLVEGEPDVVAMWSIGFPAVGVPGVATWKAGWEQRFAKFERVRIVFDCDEEGRAAAAKRSAALSSVTDVSVVDLKGRDGYDVGDLVLERGDKAPTDLARLSAGPASSVLRLPARMQPRPEPTDPRPPIERVRAALEARDHRVRGNGHQFSSTCPNHDDRNPSLSLAVGDDQRVLVHCHAGCEPRDVIGSLGLKWEDLFAA